MITSKFQLSLSTKVRFIFETLIAEPLQNTIIQNIIIISIEPDCYLIMITGICAAYFHIIV